MISLNWVSNTEIRRSLTYALTQYVIYANVGSPKVRSKKRVTMADIERGFDELSAQTTEMSSHVSNAGKLLLPPYSPPLTLTNFVKTNK